MQIGNCGAPIETSEGWLVLTHGVGPMRAYSIGVALLDLDEPGRLRASLAEPLMLFVMAGLIGTIVVGMLLPVFTMQDFIK